MNPMELRAWLAMIAATSSSNGYVAIMFNLLAILFLYQHMRSN